jgi:hypothetical protein
LPAAAAAAALPGALVAACACGTYETLATLATLATLTARNASARKSTDEESIMPYTKRSLTESVVRLLQAGDEFKAQSDSVTKDLYEACQAGDSAMVLSIIMGQKPARGTDKLAARSFKLLTDACRDYFKPRGWKLATTGKGTLTFAEVVPESTPTVPWAGDTWATILDAEEAGEAAAREEAAAVAAAVAVAGEKAARLAPPSPYQIGQAFEAMALGYETLQRQVADLTVLLEAARAGLPKGKRTVSHRGVTATTAA